MLVAESLHYMGVKSMVYGYCRVSTDTQADAGHSMEAQREAIERYCAGRGIGEPVIMADGGVSAGKPLARRPEGERLCGLLRRGDHVVATRLDRLYRSASDCLTTVEAWQRAGVELHLIALNLDTSSPTGRLILQVMAAVAELERSQVKERTQAVSSYLRRAGRAYSPTPYGYRREGERLVPEPVEQAACAEMARLRAWGSSLRDICAALARRGIPTRAGGPWQASTVRQVLLRPPVGEG